MKNISCFAKVQATTRESNSVDTGTIKNAIKTLTYPRKFQPPILKTSTEVK